MKIEPDTDNNLTKNSVIDALQLRGVDLQRFIHKLGIVSDTTMLEIKTAIVTVIEAEF